MLWFIGLGISGFESIPNRAIDVISNADVVYLEQFTSPINDRDLSKIRDMCRGRFRLGRRWMIEDGKEILNDAVDKTTVLLTYGDPYIATTHIELRARATSQGIETRSIHAASALTAIIGQCGLHVYKVGRIATIMSETNLLVTPYYTIYKNLIEGYHTLLLLEYNQDRDFFIAPNTALGNLLDTESGQQRGVVTESTWCIIASRVGQTDQRIVAGKISSLIDIDFGPPPHSIIIPGTLHFTESDALEAFVRCIDAPTNNTEMTTKISAQMLNRYIPMIHDAIQEIEPLCANIPNIDQILENAKLYVQDAERFLQDGHEEVAVLSVGYADGLVDAIRIQCGLEPKIADTSN